MKKLRILLGSASRPRSTVTLFLLSAFCFLLAYAPFHVFISQWIGTSTGGLEFWKVFKDLVLIGLFIVTGAVVLTRVPKSQYKPFGLLLVLTAVYTLLHIGLYFVNQDTSLEVAALASTYNNRFMWALLIGVGIGLLGPGATWLRQENIVRAVLVVSTVVCALGLLQVFLPDDILTHFGYQVELGVKPNFFINEDPAFPRVFATFRDPNSFAAFLIIPIMLLVQLVQKHRKKWLIGGLLVLHLSMLYLSFSRAAWGGLLVALGVYFVLSHREKLTVIAKRYWPLLLLGVIVFGGVVYSVRGTSSFRSIVLRDDGIDDSAVPGSDELHWRYIEEGVEKVVDRPLGYGPGTAGIVSIQNKDNVQLTENYYVQIAHEVGVLGLIVFLAICALVFRLLLSQGQASLVVALLAAGAAYVVMAMAMHLWTNEAVAFWWWGLAGLSLGFARKKRAKVA